ncbi:DUF2975 domain-containing protein [Dyella sp. Tek66A03]|jgi:hypothetical protein|uniref:DUF2975 domain-containing protein n=1 Tax=Dyella sp. Tek66A03 TaxID=3458298 RepID=UPI00403EB65F
MPSESTLSPSPRLIRDGKIFSWLAGLGLLATLAIDLLGVGALAFRSHRAGLMHGSFAFNVDLPWLGMIEAPDPAFVPINHFSVSQSLLCAALLALRLLPGLAILWSLMQLFGMYGHGEVFTARNTRHIRNVAWALVAYAAVPLITHASLFAAGLSAVAIRLEVRQLDALVAGLIVLALARVVSFGCAIDEDRKGFV